MAGLDDLQVRERIKKFATMERAEQRIDALLTGLPAEQRQRVLSGNSADRLLEQIDSGWLIEKRSPVIDLLLKHGLQDTPQTGAGTGGRLLGQAIMSGHEALLEVLVARLAPEELAGATFALRAGRPLKVCVLGLCAQAWPRDARDDDERHDTMVRMIETLIARGANPDGVSETDCLHPLERMAARKEIEAAKVLLRHGTASDSAVRDKVFGTIRGWMEEEIEETERIALERWMDTMGALILQRDLEARTATAVGSSRGLRL